MNKSEDLIFTVGDDLQVKERNWGTSPDLNRWLVKKTGYPYDFQSGKFGPWAIANGFDPNALVTEYYTLLV